jgi:hypothetical protein
MGTMTAALLSPPRQRPRVLPTKALSNRVRCARASWSTLLWIGK